jgi:hypothetical protein
MFNKNNFEELDFEFINFKLYDFPIAMFMPEYLNVT